MKLENLAPVPCEKGIYSDTVTGALKTVSTIVIAHTFRTSLDTLGFPIGYDY